LFQAKVPLMTNGSLSRAVQIDDQAAAQSRIFVVPAKSGVAAPPARWVGVDHPSHWDDKPRCSPNGSLLYFVSDDGYLCLWAQRLAGAKKALVGALFPVYHFHDARLSMANLDSGMLEIGAAKDRIVLGLGELTGNIWSMKPSN
jgi:hypothetical protein